MAGLGHSLTVVFFSYFVGQNRQSSVQRVRQRLDLVLIGDLAITPCRLLEAGGDLGDFDRADIEAHRFKGMGQCAARLGFAGLRVLPQLSAGVRCMLGIKIHHALEEVTFLCLVQRPQLPQGGRIEEW